MGLGGSYQEGKAEISAFLHKTLRRGASILDVGAGGGTYRYYLGSDCEMEAVEVWPEAIEELRKSYDKVYPQDIRDFRYEKTYDLVIFGDVLEHLSVEDAQRVLNEAKTHSKAIMVAVPYMYEQDALYGNEAEVHLQPDLTPEVFDERYPGFDRIVAIEGAYGYYYKRTPLDDRPKAKLCSYSICKNEKKFIDKWFENVSGADYICVLDTGSTDGTWERLQELQAQHPGKVIVKQEIITPWRFDVARNKSMELIPYDAEILISTDFDELFSEG